MGRRQCGQERNVPGLTSLPPEVDRLASSLTADARMPKASAAATSTAPLGDIDDYLIGQYEQIAAAA